MERKGLITVFTSVQKLIGKKLKIYLKHHQFKMFSKNLKLCTIQITSELNTRQM